MTREIRVPLVHTLGQEAFMQLNPGRAVCFGSMVFDSSAWIRYTLIDGATYINGHLCFGIYDWTGA